MLTTLFSNKAIVFGVNSQRHCRLGFETGQAPYIADYGGLTQVGDVRQPDCLSAILLSLASPLCDDHLALALSENQVEPASGCWANESRGVDPLHTR